MQNMCLNLVYLALVRLMKVWKLAIIISGIRRASAFSVF